MINLSKKIAVLLSVLMAAVLVCGCSDNAKEEKAAKEKAAKESIVGEWEGELDLTSVFNDQLDDIDDDMASYIEFKDLTVETTFTFDEDGVMALETNRKSVEKMVDKIEEQTEEGVITAVKALIKKDGKKGMSVDEYLEEEGYTLDEVIEEIKELLGLDEDTAEDLYYSFQGSQEYKLKNGKIILGDDKDKYFEYEMSGDTLTLTKAHGGDYDGMEFWNSMCPIELTKQ